jgi:hypothetical protein
VIRESEEDTTSMIKKNEKMEIEKREEVNSNM